MFDIGFWELCLTAVIALLVFGPEKLPGIAREAGLWIGRIRHFIVKTRQDIDRELRLQALQESMKLDDRVNPYEILEKLGKSDSQTANQTESPTTSPVSADQNTGSQSPTHMI